MPRQRRRPVVHDPDWVMHHQDGATTNVQPCGCLCPSLDAQTKRLVDAAPPLSPAQRDRLAVLLRPRGA